MGRTADGGWSVPQEDGADYVLVCVPLCLLSYEWAESSSSGHDDSAYLPTCLGQSHSCPQWIDSGEASSCGEEGEEEKESGNG